MAPRKIIFPRDIFERLKKISIIIVQIVMHILVLIMPDVKTKLIHCNKTENKKIDADLLTLRMIDQNG